MRPASHRPTSSPVASQPDCARRRCSALLTSINRCWACERVHSRWALLTGLRMDDPRRIAPDEAAAYAYGQAVAIGGPWSAPPPSGLSPRHRQELQAAAILMELANLAGNRFLPARVSQRRLQIGGPALARLYDRTMRVADWAGLHRARTRTAAGAVGAVLEIGIGTGLNLAAYPPDISIHGLDPSGSALAIAARRARRLDRAVALTEGNAAALPYPDRTFDIVVGTFVLCSVGDVAPTLTRCARSGACSALAGHFGSSSTPVRMTGTSPAFSAGLPRPGLGRLEAFVSTMMSGQAFRQVGSRSPKRIPTPVDCSSRSWRVTVNQPDDGGLSDGSKVTLSPRRKSRGREVPAPH